MRNFFRKLFGFSNFINLTVIQIISFLTLAYLSHPAHPFGFKNHFLQTENLLRLSYACWVAIVIWGMAYLVPWMSMRCNLKKQWAQLLYIFFFTVTIATLLVQLTIAIVFRTPLTLDLCSAILEPGILREMGIFGRQIFHGVATLVGIAIFQYLIIQPTDFFSLRTFGFRNKIQILILGWEFFLLSIGFMVHPSVLIQQIKDAIYFKNLFYIYEISTRSYDIDQIYEITPPMTHRQTRKEAFSFLNSSKQLSQKNKWNILIIGAESLRADMFNETNMPKTYRFAQKNGVSLPHHFSTGNKTPTGLYGLLAGMSAITAPRPNQSTNKNEFFTILKRLGYKNSIYETVKLDFGNMDRNIFGNDIDEHHLIDSVKKYSSITNKFRYLPINQDDQKMATGYADGLVKDLQGLHFDFIFFYSTHYNYYYPKPYETFRPALGVNFNIHKIREKRTELFNRYKNSVLFLDSLIEEILKKLVDSNLLSKTIVIITGDHGEGFSEGQIGHGFSLNTDETQVPFVLIAPGKLVIQSTISSHMDVIPTLLELIGIQGMDVSSIYPGKSLLQQGDSPHTAFISAFQSSFLGKRNTLINNGHKLSFVFKSGKILVINVTDLADKKITISDEQLHEDLEMIRNHRNFYKLS